MKLIPSLLGGFAVLVATTGACAAAAPAASAPPATPAPAVKTDAKPAAPAPPAAKMSDYTVELTARVELTDAEKKQVEAIYADDGVALQKILNDDSLSPLQKAQQVADLRAARNAKIEVLLHDLDRQKAFREIEAIYRVALTEYAADGGLVPPAPATPSPAVAAPAPAPVPTSAPAAAPALSPKPAKDAPTASPFPAPGQ